MCRNIEDEPTSEPRVLRAQRPDGKQGPGKGEKIIIQGPSAKRKGEAGRDSTLGVQCRWTDLHQ